MLLVDQKPTFRWHKHDKYKAQTSVPDQCFSNWGPWLYYWRSHEIFILFQLFYLSVLKKKNHNYFRLKIKWGGLYLVIE